ncbi:transposase, partial [Trichonephila clavipes]
QNRLGLREAGLSYRAVALVCSVTAAQSCVFESGDGRGSDSSKIREGPRKCDVSSRRQTSGFLSRKTIAACDYTKDNVHRSSAYRLAADRLSDKSRFNLWHHDGRIRATRGLLATNHVILNHGQVTWRKPELAPPSPNYHTNGKTFQLSTDLTCIAALHVCGLGIHQNDHQARRRFVEWAQNEIAVVPDFHKRILFSDEAHLWLNGYVNKQNCRIWSEANPQVYVETPLHPEKLTVWCALWAGGILLQKR